MPTDCPNREQLQNWLDDQDADVSSHVDTCIECEQTVRTLLEACDPFLNSFREVVIHAVLNLDGSLVATGGADGTIRVYKSETLEIHTIIPGLGAVDSLCWSPDGRYIAAGDVSGQLIVWDLATGRVVRRYRFAGEHSRIVTSVAWSPDGSQLAVRGPGDGVLLFDLEHAASEPRLLTNEPFVVVAWSHDGERLAVGSSEHVKLFDVKSGNAIRSLVDAPQEIASISWSPDDRLIAAGSHQGGISVWNADGPHLHSTDGKYFAWSEESDRLIVTASDKLVAWNTSDWVRENDIVARAANLEGGCSLVGRTLSYAHPARTSFSVGDLQTHTFRLSPAGHRGERAALAWSPTGHRIATVHQSQEIVVFDPTTASVCGVHNTNDAGLQGKPKLCWSPNGDSIACGGDAAIGLLGLTEAQFPGFRRIPTPASIHAIDWSNAGIATLDSAGTISVWDPALRESLRQFATEPSMSGALAWAADGKFLAFGVKGKHQIWDALAEDVPQVASMLPGQSSAVAYSPDGRSLCFVKFGRLYVKDLETRTLVELRRGDENAHDDWIWVIKWTPDGKRIVTHGDSSIRIWDAASENLEREIPATQATWLSAPMDLSPDGHTFAVAGPDRVVRLWRTEDGSPLLDYSTLSSSDWLVIAPNGNWIGSEHVEQQLVYLVETDAGVERLRRNDRVARPWACDLRCGYDWSASRAAEF